MLFSKNAIALFLATSMLSSIAVFGEDQAVWGQSNPILEDQPQTSNLPLKRKERAKNAKDFIQDGIQKLEEQQFRAALVIFQQVQKDYPKLKKKERVTLLDSLGQTYLYIAERDKANEVLEQALVLYRDRKDKPNIAHTLVRLSRTNYRHSDEAKAYASLDEALALYQELDDRAGQANVVFAKTMVDTYAGPFFHTKVRTENLEVLYKALELMREAGDRHGEGRVWMAIGEAYYDTLNDYDRSYESFRKALKIFQNEGDSHNEIITTWLMGYVSHAKEDYPNAIKTYQKAIALAQQNGHIDTELFIHQYLGETYKRTEQFDHAIVALNDALKLAQETEKRFEQGDILQGLGSIYGEMEQYSDSLSSYQKATLAFWENRGRQCKSNKTAALGEAYSRILSNRDTYQENARKTTEYYQQALEIEQQQGTVECEFHILDALESQYNLADDIPKVLGVAQRTLEILETTSTDRLRENFDLDLLLSSLAFALDFGEDPKAYEPILQTSYRAAKKFGKEDNIQKNLIELGHLHRLLRNESQALDYYRQGFLVYGKMKDYACPTQPEFAQGLAYLERSKRTSRYHQRFVKEKQAVYDGYYSKAVQTFETALKNESKDVCKIILLNQLNLLYKEKLNNSGIINNISQIRVALQQLDDPTFKESDVAKSLITFLDKNISSVQTSIIFDNKTKDPISTEQDQSLSDLELSLLQEVIRIAKRLDNKELELITLGSLSKVYSDRGDYRTALDFSEEGLSLAEENYILKGRIDFLTTLGSLYSLVGNYEESNQYYQNSLTVQGQLSNWKGEISSLVALAQNQYSQGDFDQSIALANQALDIVNTQKDKSFSRSILLKYGSFDGKSPESLQEIVTWIPFEIPISLILSSSYTAQGQTDKSLQLINHEIATLEKAEVATQKMIEQLIQQGKIAEDNPLLERLRTGAAMFYASAQWLKTFRGEIYYQSGDLTQATVDFQQGISLGDEVISFNRLAYLGLARVYRDMKLPTVAVTYYKKVIRTIEETREQIQELPEALQASFLTATFDFSQTPVEDIYRELADLLISEGRIAEAQEILELLKQKELNEFTKGTRAEKALPEITFSQLDQQVTQKQESLTQLGQKLLQCKIDRCSELEMSALRAEQRKLQATFIEEMKAIEASLRDRRLDQVSTGKRDFVASAQKLVKAQPDSMLIYPLVLKDKIHLLWASSGGVFSSKTCPLGEAEAWTLISEFRELLSTPQSDIESVKDTGQELYACLVQPLETEIAAGQIKHLIFVPDRATNYIPMAALYDGQQFLTEKYVTSSVLSAGLTDMDARLPDSTESTSTLALGVSKAIAGFSSLPNVTEELDAIVKEDKRDQGIFPGDALLDQNFDENTLYNQLSGQQILHIATHGEFIPEDPKASYLLTGTGKKLPIYELEFLETLRDVHLVVLSACETALGGPDQNGIEIAGISSYFLQDKAKSVLASLWQVNDDSTNQLMQTFYHNLSQSNGGRSMGKGEALRRAQVALLTGNRSSAGDEQRGRIVIRDKAQNASLPFSHPYYWAPFILIGNSR